MSLSNAVYRRLQTASFGVKPFHVILLPTNPIPVSPPQPVHPKGEADKTGKSPLTTAMEVETFAGKIHVEWDPTAAVTPIGQLPFFIEFLKLGHRFNPWVETCPLHYASPNAPSKIDVLEEIRKLKAQVKRLEINAWDILFRNRLKFQDNQCLIAGSENGNIRRGR